MKKTNKKGFTIVELVIVIAVIAILSAVLIPTFSGIIKKAKIAQDTAVARNLNTAAISEEVDNFDDALIAVKDAGYLIANLNAKASDCYFVWDEESNQFFIYDLKKSEIVYSNTQIANQPNANWFFAISDPEVAKDVKEVLSIVNIKQTVESVTDLKGWISDGGTQTIYIDESIKVDSEDQIVIESGEITLKVTGSNITGNNDNSYSVENVPFYVNGGKLTIEGGTISATGSWLDADGDPVDSVVVAEAGELNITNSTVLADGKDIILAFAGANGTISNTKIVANSSAINVGGNSNVTVENCTIDVFCEAVWVSTTGGCNDSSATIKSGTYSGVGNTIALYGGKVIIEDGTFSAQQTNLFRFYATGSSITIKGGTFTTASGTYTFAELNETILKGMMSASSAGTVTVTQNADGSFTIAN